MGGGIPELDGPVSVAEAEVGTVTWLATSLTTALRSSLSCSSCISASETDEEDNSSGNSGFGVVASKLFYKVKETLFNLHGIVTILLRLCCSVRLQETEVTSPCLRLGGCIGDADSVEVTDDILVTSACN